MLAGGWPIKHATGAGSGIVQVSPTKRQQGAARRQPDITGSGRAAFMAAGE